jgi:hypothetical protein
MRGRGQRDATASKAAFATNSLDSHGTFGELFGEISRLEKAMNYVCHCC